MLQLCLLLHSRGALLDARVHDVLALALLLLRRHLVDDLLLLVLGFLLGEQGRLLSCELIFSTLLLIGVMTATFKSWEEIVEENALAWLDFSTFALGGLLFAISRGWFRGTAPTRAYRWNILGVDLSSGPRIVTLLTFRLATKHAA